MNRLHEHLNVLIRDHGIQAAAQKVESWNRTLEELKLAGLDCPHVRRAVSEARERLELHQDRPARL